jgi:predicted dehydrogenase
LGKGNINRREFLKKATVFAAGAVTLPCFVPSSALGKAGSVAPSNQITVGWIGTGPQGNQVISNFLSQKDARVVAVCDVKTSVRQAAQQRVNQHYQSQGCAAYSDFRELLARDDIDAILVATPDHWHVLNALAAAKAGKDMYLEKPMGLSVAEDQALRDAVRRRGIVFQFGTQQRSDWQFHRACELVRNGRIGKLDAINVWCPSSVRGRPMNLEPVPKGFDYDMWLGPAAYVPYSHDRCFGNSNVSNFWWFISNYALGFIAGWGVHPLDIALWGGGEKLAGPVEIEGSAVFPNDGECDTAVSWNLVCKYPSGVVVNYAAVETVLGSNPTPAKWQRRYGKTTSHGTVFEGSEGWILVDRTGIYAHPKSLLDSVIKPGEIGLYKSSNHVRNLLDCIKSRAQTVCGIDTAVRSDIICHVSYICTRLGRPLKWDPENERFVNDETANRLLSRPMRSPWHL